MVVKSGASSSLEANFKFVSSTEKEPCGNQTKSYKVERRANTREEK
jgi:hypothetical protein